MAKAQKTKQTAQVVEKLTATNLEEAIIKLQQLTAGKRKFVESVDIAVNL